MALAGFTVFHETAGIEQFAVEAVSLWNIIHNEVESARTAQVAALLRNLEAYN